ncbi:hypothetical protein [Vannielia litorea]|uniref:hypothetical protein n=1 Tax=Vannielia litorea TaxID=1217970 RepID=UPI001BCDD43E|nr:hypothetical protein [Vannielia litorea]MBS8228310.1 hypothetical protein [Vannielia litorea]
MRLVVALGVMQPRGFRALFRIFPGTYRALRSARWQDACVAAQIFRRGRLYYAMSVWEEWGEMRDWARRDGHGAVARLAETQMVRFRNHSWETDEVPSREEARRRWAEIEAAA